MLHTIVCFTPDGVMKDGMHIVIEALVEESIAKEVALKYQALNMLTPA